MSGGREGILSELLRTVFFNDVCAQRYAHKREQFLNVYLVTFGQFLCVFCKGLVCVFVCSCVNLDHFGYLFSKFVLLSLIFFGNGPMTYFV